MRIDDMRSARVSTNKRTDNFDYPEQTLFASDLAEEAWSLVNDLSRTLEELLDMAKKENLSPKAKVQLQNIEDKLYDYRFDKLPNFDKFCCYFINMRNRK